MYVEPELRDVRGSAMPTTEFLKLAGISKSRIYEIEYKNSYIYPDEIEKIAEILTRRPELILKGLQVCHKASMPFQRKNKENAIENLRPKQKAIIDFIRNYPQQYPPTVHEIAEGVGIKSSSTVYRHITKLIKLGLVERKAKYPKCIILTDRNHGVNGDVEPIPTQESDNIVDIEQREMVPVVGTDENDTRKLVITEELECSIECLRERMHVTALEKGMLHPDVLTLSHKIDERINEFYKIDTGINEA